MKIYAVKYSDGCWDDRQEGTEIITENEEKAYSVLFEQAHETNEIEIWENDILISSYFRDYDNIGKEYGKWEINYGQKNERLEKENEKRT